MIMAPHFWPTLHMLFTRPVPPYTDTMQSVGLQYDAAVALVHTGDARLRACAGK